MLEVDSRSVGMARELLDQGCRSVLESPWPINAFAGERWLESFLNEWEDGKIVLTATPVANEAVHRRYSHPRDWAAMHVYGDPLRQRSSAGQRSVQR